MSQAEFELKGSLFTLSALQMYDNDLSKLQLWLAEKVKQAPEFFYRAPIIINIATLADVQLDFVAIKNIVEQADFILVGISGASKEQKIQIKAAGLAAVNHSHQQSHQQVKATATKVTTVEKVVEKERVIEKPTFAPAKIIEQTIRSGQQIYAKDTDLIVKGAVSAGAEVIADGNIHIYGTLRGRAIAGAQGNSAARIYCSNIQAELVSINGNYWLSDSLQDKAWAKAACISLVDEQLAIQELS